MKSRGKHTKEGNACIKMNLRVSKRLLDYYALNFNIFLRPAVFEQGLLLKSNFLHWKKSINRIPWPRKQTSTKRSTIRSQASGTQKLENTTSPIFVPVENQSRLRIFYTYESSFKEFSLFIMIRIINFRLVN